MPVPEEVRQEVAASLYERLDALCWEELSSRDKSEAYGNFVSDPTIGGRLAPYLGSDRIRVWIKDGPAKEYGRALEGVGAYAGYTRRAFVGPQGVVSAVLGDSWSVREGSVKDKPMCCWADSPDGASRFVIWGAHQGVKDLVWQAVLHRADHPESKPVIILTRREVTALPKHVRNHAERVCAIVGAEYRETRRPVVAKPTAP